MTSQESRIERLVNLLGWKRGRELDLGAITLSSLARQVGTPLYLYSGDAIAAQVQQTRQALGLDTELRYSVKANPSLGVCQVIAGQGIGAEVASSGELLLAQKAGFSLDSLLFIGPGKTDAELELAIKLGIEAIIVESVGEMERVARIAARYGRPARVGVRVNVAEPVKGFHMRMGGGPQQFGVDEEQLPALLDQFKQYPSIRIVGVQVYAGTQMFDVGALTSHCSHVADLGAQMADLLGYTLEFVDFGGGFGVPYYENSQEFDLQSFSTGFRGVVERCRRDPRLASAKLVVELGRYLVADAGLYVTRVVDVKRSHGKTFVVTDGGMNHHITATGNFGQVFRKPFPIANLDKMDSPIGEPVAIVGPNCTPLDVFAQNVAISPAEVGDLIGVFCSGAYGYSASSLGFLSHPTPAEVLLWMGKVHLLRPPGRPEQVLEGQIGLESGELAVLDCAAPQSPGPTEK